MSVNKISHSHRGSSVYRREDSAGSVEGTPREVGGRGQDSGGQGMGGGGRGRDTGQGGGEPGPQGVEWNGLHFLRYGSYQIPGMLQIVC